MYKDDCIFCKLVQWQIPSAKIWENDTYIAILDAFPACKGMTVVLPKQHYASDIFTLDDTIYTWLFQAVKEAVVRMKTWLWVERVGIAVEWLQVNHAHVKLYPFRNGKSFEWWLTGHTMVDIDELQAVAKQIREKNR